MISKEDFLTDYIEAYNRMHDDPNTFSNVRIDKLGYIVDKKEMIKAYNDYRKCIKNSTLDKLNGLSCNDDYYIDAFLSYLDDLELIDFKGYFDQAEEIEYKKEPVNKIKRKLLILIDGLQRDAIRALQENENRLIISKDTSVYFIDDQLLEPSEMGQCARQFDGIYKQLNIIYDYIAHNKKRRYVVVDNSVDDDITDALIIDTQTLTAVISDDTPQNEQQEKKIFNENISDKIYNLI